MFEGMISRVLALLRGRKMRLRYWIALGLAALLLPAYFVIFRLPIVQAQHLPGSVSPLERATVENEFRRTMIQLVAGVALAAGLGLTAWRIWVSSRQVTVTEDGQITNRFTEAIRLLASSDLYSRLGAIYALERIARDSAKDHWTIMEVLSAYICKPPAQSPGIVPTNATEGSTVSEDLRADVQAAFTVIARRAHWQTEGEKRLRLSQADLRSARLFEGHLENAIIMSTHLENSFLRGVHLEHAGLLFAQLDGASLDEAHMEAAMCPSTSFRGATLEGAHLEMASMQGARFSEANLTGAYLLNANLRKADFRNAVLKGAHVGGAKLDGCKFGYTDLRDCGLQDTMGWARVVVEAICNVDGAKGIPAGLLQRYKDAGLFTEAKSDKVWDQQKKAWAAAPGRGIADAMRSATPDG